MQSSNILKTANRIIDEHPEYFDALVEFEKTGRLPRLKYKERVNFTIDSDLIKKLRRYSKKHGYKMSNVVERILRKELS